MFWSTSTWILDYIWVGGFCQHQVGVNLECFGLYQDRFFTTSNSASVRLGWDLRGVVLWVVG